MHGIGIKGNYEFFNDPIVDSYLQILIN